MSTGLIIVLVVLAVIILLVLLLLARKGRQKQLDARREQAREIRSEAEVASARADHARAQADEQAAKAQREQAQARERAAEADAQADAARERHMDAARTDPDQDEGEVAERLDRGEAPKAVTRENGRGVVREDVSRSRDPETDEVLGEEVRGRRYEHE